MECVRMEPVGPLIPQISLLDLSNQSYLFVYLKGSKKIAVFMWAGGVLWDPFIFRFVFHIVSAEAFPHKIIWEWAGAEMRCLQGCTCMGLTEVELGSINSLVFCSTHDYFSTFVSSAANWGCHYYFDHSQKCFLIFSCLIVEHISASKHPKYLPNAWVEFPILSD